MPSHEAVPAWATPRNPARETLGPAVAKIAEALGTPFMPWQHELAAAACEIDPETGLFWYRDVRVIVPRQAGKTTFVRAKGSHRCLSMPNQRLVYTAQTRIMARQRLEVDFYEPIKASPLRPFLPPNRREPKKPGWHGSTGDEYIEFKTGSRWRIDATTETAGHGPTLHEGHIDEAFALVDGRVEQAMRPAMITVRGAQLWTTSAAGNHRSAYLWPKVEDGRARVESGIESRVFYLEYSAPVDADPDDPATILGCHPAVGHTIAIEDVQADRQAMNDDAEFGRAYYGWWPRESDRPWAIPKQAWRDCGTDPETVNWDGAPVWSVDIAPNRDMAAIGFAATTDDGRPWLEVAAHDYGEGWVLPHLVKLRSQFGGELVVLDGAGPAAALEPELEEAGFTVRRLTQRQKVDACGALHRGAQQGTLLHGNDPRMDATLQSAAKRKSGDAWVWGRGISSDDITPLYSLTLARFVWVEEHANDYDLLDSVR